jgi:hypothetical protein
MSCLIIRRIGRFSLLLAVALSLSVTANAQNEASFDGKIDTTLDANKRTRIVDTVISTLNKYYIHPEQAAEMAELLRKNLADGAYDDFQSRNPFIRQLTKDLRSVTHDLHLGVWPIEWSLTLDEISEEAKAEEARMLRYSNYGLPTVRRLQGNIGYLEILDFTGPDKAAEAMAAAMNFLSSSDALVIDLRRCGGGEGYSGRLLLSYLFKEPTYYATIFTRYTDSTDQAWTMPFVPGPRMTDIPVYVLQSRRTASAAEAMSYFLQTLKRATIVGEKSRGAANPVDELNFPDLSITVAVSISEVTSPVTGTGWEGIGIKPDIDVPAESALPAACRDAMEKVIKKDMGENIRKLHQWALDMYNARLNPIALSDSDMDRLCGEYSSSVSVWKDDGRLHMRRAEGEPAVTLIPLGNDEFAVEEREARARFVRNPDGTVKELKFVFADGYDYTFKRLDK